MNHRRNPHVWWQLWWALVRCAHTNAQVGAWKISMARLWEANQNIFLNDNKLLKRLDSLIHVGTGSWLKAANRKLPRMITHAMLLYKQSTPWPFNSSCEKQFKLVNDITIYLQYQPYQYLPWDINNQDTESDKIQKPFAISSKLMVTRKGEFWHKVCSAILLDTLMKLMFLFCC